MITRNFNLHLNAGHSIPLVINVNQYDSGEQWVFTLFNSDGTQYTPSTGAIVGIKSDGLGIINSGSVVDGKVVINETQQMTAAVGKAVFELTIDSGTHGTANFVVLVEEKPGNNADLSDSDLSLIQEALNAVNPLPTGGSVGQVLTKTANGSAWSDAGTPTQEQVAEAVSAWADENITVETGVVIDQSLSVQGAAADAKKTGDEISDLKSQIAQSAGLTADIKQALMAVVNNVAWSGDDPTGQTYIDDLYDALYPPVEIDSITASFTQSGTIYDIADLDDLRTDLVVTANYSDGTHGSVSQYTLSGTLEAGTSTITVSYREKTTSFDVTVTASLPSGYTKYDYLYQTSAGSKAQNYMINLATYPNLNRISLDMKVKVLSVLGGYAIIGGRSESGYTSSFAFYANNGYTNGSLTYHVHGVESNATVGHNIPFDINAVHSLKYTATTESPSVIEVDGETYETEWVNDNVINRHLTLLSNPIGTNNQRLSENIQIGRIIVKDENGDVLNRYVPCVQDSSNKIGMYDIDNQVFYTPTKSGVAVIGNSACIYQVGNWS